MGLSVPGCWGNKRHLRGEALAFVNRRTLVAERSRPEELGQVGVLESEPGIFTVSGGPCGYA